MIDTMIKDLTERMDKAVSAFKQEMGKLRTGRATPALLESIRVDYYGTPTPLTQMATVTTPDARLIVIQPWDLGAIGDIEKAIHKSDLGLTPQNDGKVLRLPIPPLTAERRQEIVKVIHKHAEECRVAVRNIRRTGMEDLKKAEKDKKLSEDDRKRAEKKIQELTDGCVKKADAMAETKSKEILAV